MPTQEKKCYNVSQDVRSVQREGITQQIVKAREHVFDAKDDIIQASVKEIKTVQDNKLIMIKERLRVTTIKIAKEIMTKRNIKNCNQHRDVK